MIKTIILLVIVFYTFPCRKINAQSRDTSNIFAGYYIAVYNKSDLSHKKIRRHHKHSYNTAIDSRYRTYFIPIKIGKNNINQENIWKEVMDNKKESDTIFIFPDSTDIKLFKQIGLIDSNISDKKHLLLQEIKSLPYYNTASNKAYLFKCLYVKGTFLQLRIDTIDKNWQDYLLDIYSISTKKKLLLVTGIDSLHSIKSDGTGNAPDWELSFYVPIVNLSQSSKVGRIAMANNATNANIATSALLPTTPTKSIFLTQILKSSN